MKVEVMQRTMQALADMDLDAAKTIMQMAEAIAEQFPRPDMSAEIEEADIRQAGSNILTLEMARKRQSKGIAAGDYNPQIQSRQPNYLTIN